MSSQRPGTRGRRHGGQGQGNAGGRREQQHHRQALRQDRHRNRPRSTAALTASCCSRPRTSPNGSAASSCTMRPSARRPATACRSRSISPSSASFPASRSIPGAKPLALHCRRDHHRGSRWPAGAPRWSTTSSARVSPSGARSSTSAAAFPRAGAIEANAHALARYAALCQEQNIVPIVEPEVLMDGAHTHRALRRGHRTPCSPRYSAQLQRAALHLEGMILKPNMVIAGKKCPTQATPEQVAAATIRCLKRHVPARCPASPSCPAASPRPRRRCTSR